MKRRLRALLLHFIAARADEEDEAGHGNAPAAVGGQEVGAFA
jgi:hypothetical protein